MKMIAVFLVFVSAFPFEGNWNLLPGGRKNPGDILSTAGQQETETAPEVVCICFPVWRELKHIYMDSSGDRHQATFVSAFPFEGNWNVGWKCSRLELAAGLYLLSRLKGIETPLPHTFPQTLSGLYLLSRLKGIETRLIRCTLIGPFAGKFVSAFPFEGNWNVWGSDRSPRESAFVSAFPFEGNWNRWAIQGHLPTARVCICFPVWRELKPCPFPQTGNGRPVCICFPVWRELKHNIRPVLTVLIFFRLYLLSRLKGIETLFPNIGEESLAVGEFVSAFPFEGNWNYVGLKGPSYR